jgi:GTP1/Obg family GTP-binding protein
MFMWSDKKGELKELTPQQEEILLKIARKVVHWKMSVPAILFLESVKPLNYVGSQMMAFFAPFVETLFSWKDYDEFRKMMEERETIERLLQKIEKLDAEAMNKEKETKRERKLKRNEEGRKRNFKEKLKYLLIGK